MRGTTLLVLLALAVGTPLAGAQTQPNLVLALSAPEHLVRAGESQSFAGTVTFVSEATASTQLTGIQITYVVKQAPEWASVIVSPANDVLTPQGYGGPVGPTVHATKTFTVMVTGTQGGTHGDVAAIVIEAVTQGGLLFRPAHALGSAPVQYEGVDECDVHEPKDPYAVALQEAEAEPAPATAEPEEDAPEVHQVQSAARTPVSVPWAVVGACAAAGAGVGYALRRRRA